MSRQRSLVDKRDQTPQEVLNQYVDWLNQDDGRITSVSETISASKPEGFVRAMSRYSWSNHAVFRTDAGSANSSDADLSPLPFPPMQLRCAVLAHSYTTDPALRVSDDHEIIGIARHEAGDEAAWVVHVLAAQIGAPAMTQLLEAIGCDLPVE